MLNLICLPIWATKGPAPAYTHWCQVKPFTLLQALIKSLSIIRENIYKREITHGLVGMALVTFFLDPALLNSEYWITWQEAQNGHPAQCSAHNYMLQRRI